MGKKTRGSTVPVRIKTVLPTEPMGISQTIVSHYVSACRDAGRPWTVFSFDKIPKSVNHQYIHTRHNTRLNPQVFEFRRIVKDALAKSNIVWKPSGMSAAVILLMSPLWVTKTRFIRKMDADNRVKPIFDAIEQCTGSEDERHWNFHVFKILSKEERVIVYLFDLGDVVDYHVY